MRKLSPETKQAIEQQVNAQTRRALAFGEKAGWTRGFRVGALLGVAIASLVGLIVAALGMVLS